MGKFKTIGIIAAVALSAFFILSIGLYYLITMMPTKTVDWTVNVSELKNVEDGQNNVIYVKYYSNKNGNGVELLDIKITGYIDATQIDNPDAITYSKGIQLVGTDYQSIDFTQKTKYKYDSLSVLFGQQQTTFKYYTPKVDSYFYDTQNGISSSSEEGLSSNDIFKVSVGDDLYLMKLIGEDSQSGDTKNAFWMSNVNTSLYDENYLAKIMIDTCRSNNIGLDNSVVYTKQINCFQYRKYSDTTGKWLTNYDLEQSNLLVDFTNNVTIHIETFSDGATKADDSLFGIIENKADFEFINGQIATDYFNGEQCVLLDENSFTYLKTSENKYIFTLKNSVINYLNEHTNKINIIIDKDVLLENNIKFECFDETLLQLKNRINYVQFKSVDASTGEIVYEEVTLWANY